jgi:pimeloyl-ACP methyl ester carboxylesterase
MEDRYALLDGTRVYYRSQGFGSKSIVLIHGWACDSSFWDMNLTTLLPGIRVVALDLAGHGLSDKPRVAYTQQYLARGVASVLADAEIKKALIIAHSMGMSVARYYLEEQPQHVLALVDVESRSLFFGEREDSTKAERTQFARSIRGPNAAVAWQDRVERFFVPETPTSVKEFVRKRMLLTPSHVSAYEWLNRTHSWSDRPTDVPTLGLYASPLSPMYENLLSRMFRQLQVQIWPNVGHFLMLEKPDLFKRTVTCFFSAFA